MYFEKCRRSDDDQVESIFRLNHVFITSISHYYYYPGNIIFLPRRQHCGIFATFHRRQVLKLQTVSVCTTRAVPQWERLSDRGTPTTSPISVHLLWRCLSPLSSSAAASSSQYVLNVDWPPASLASRDRRRRRRWQQQPCFVTQQQAAAAAGDRAAR